MPSCTEGFRLVGGSARYSHLCRSVCCCGCRRRSLAGSSDSSLYHCAFPYSESYCGLSPNSQHQQRSISGHNQVLAAVQTLVTKLTQKLQEALVKEDVSQLEESIELVKYSRIQVSHGNVLSRTGMPQLRVCLMRPELSARCQD